MTRGRAVGSKEHSRFRRINYVITVLSREIKILCYDARADVVVATAHLPVLMVFSRLFMHTLAHTHYRAGYSNCFARQSHIGSNRKLQFFMHPVFT